MRTRLFLNPSNTQLAGSIPPDAEHIHIVLDSAQAPFDVYLPDVTLPEHREFIFYNYPSSGEGHPVRVLPVSGQFLIVDDTEHMINPMDTVSFCADLRQRWLLTDVNTHAEDILTITGDYVITKADLGKVIVCDSAVPMNLTLPEATESGYSFKIVNVGSANVTLTALYSVINGDVSQYLIQWDVFVVYDYAMGKWVIGL